MEDGGREITEGVNKDSPNKIKGAMFTIWDYKASIDLKGKEIPTIYVEIK